MPLFSSEEFTVTVQLNMRIISSFFFILELQSRLESSELQNKRLKEASVPVFQTLFIFSDVSCLFSLPLTLLLLLPIRLLQIVACWKTGL